MLVAHLAGGQTVGHLLLTFTAGHQHGGSHATLPMLVAHGVAALVLAVLIGTAERSLAALAGVPVVLVREHDDRYLLVAGDDGADHHPEERERAEEHDGGGPDRHSSTSYAKQIWRDVKNLLNPPPRKKRT